MDKTKLLKNIEAACEAKGEKVTPACRNAGVGHSFVQHIKNGQVPSVEKLSQLAAYLGVTTSELLGEDPPNGSGSQRRQVDDEDIKAAFWGGMDNLSPAEIESLWAQVKKYKDFLTEEKIKEQKPSEK